MTELLKSEVETTSSDIPAYQLGSNDDNGYRIKSIIGKDDNFVVYLTGTGSLKWKITKKNQENYLYAISLANSQASKVHATVPVKQQNQAMWMVGHALFSSFHLNDPNEIAEYFKAPAMYIETAREEHLHQVYILTSLVLSLLMLVITIGLRWYFNDVKALHAVTAMVAGTFGAFVSILHRFKDIEISSFSASEYIRIRSIVRTLVGSIFGVVVFIAYEGKLIPGVVDSTQYTLYFFAFVSGFSERFIPDLIKRFEAKNENKK